jgi:hypothetical protein
MVKLRLLLRLRLLMLLLGLVLVLMLMLLLGRLLGLLGSSIAMKVLVIRLSGLLRLL